MNSGIFKTRDIGNIMNLRSFQRRRESSFNRSGSNIDFIVIKPGEKRVIFDVEGPGCITHIWSTQLTFLTPFYPRHVIVRIWWDDEEQPSVECPLGDFFGLGHGEIIEHNSLPVQMSPQNGKGMNIFTAVTNSIAEIQVHFADASTIFTL